eukprot:TRINITY_DN5683_c0_g1_i1.p1 TRINITY_DN5683_c0_g1~~TRINITY_DN5683_c0_g1_i1.p1  ORF type:complete len:185 (-),score=46.03 TRINITY_DN5683_c0_g1_i1:94-609(-)
MHRAALALVSRPRGAPVRPSPSLHLQQKRWEHGTGWPKPSSREPLLPFERDAVAKKLDEANISDPEIREEILDLQGWLFGKKRIYVAANVKIYDNLSDDAKFVFGERPPPPGYKRYMQDWEILTYAAIIGFFIMCLTTWWAKPETDMLVWAKEELRERRILARREQLLESS